MARVGEYRVKLIEGTSPKHGSPCRIPEALKEEVTEQIRELLDRGMIYGCESAFVHPIVCVPKKDGLVRLCIDYNALNTVSERDAFPMGHSQELIMRVRAPHAHSSATRLLASANGRGFSALYGIHLALWSVCTESDDLQAQKQGQQLSREI